MKKKYPINKTTKIHFWLALGLSIWVFLFLYFSEPFEISQFSAKEKLSLLPIYGIIQGVCYAIAIWYQFKIIKKTSSWHITNEVVFILLVAIIGAILNYLFYKNIIANNESGTYSLWVYLSIIYVPALLIILPFVAISRFILGKFSERLLPEDNITIKGKGQYDFLNLKVNELLFVQSSNNYIEIYFIENGEVKKKLIRCTISEIQDSFPSLLKTHRSFLINPMHFKQFKTENKKLFVDLGFGNHIPVSRNLQTFIKSELQIATNT